MGSKGTHLHDNPSYVDEKESHCLWPWAPWAQTMHRDTYGGPCSVYLDLNTSRMGRGGGQGGRGVS